MHLRRFLFTIACVKRCGGLALEIRAEAAADSGLPHVRLATDVRADAHVAWVMDRLRAQASGDDEAQTGVFAAGDVRTLCAAFGARLFLGVLLLRRTHRSADHARIAAALSAMPDEAAAYWLTLCVCGGRTAASAQALRSLILLPDDAGRLS